MGDKLNFMRGLVRFKQPTTPETASIPRQPRRTPTTLHCVVGLFFVSCLAACAGPSRSQYAQLLHECREVHREDVRLNQACEERLNVNGIPAPEQSHGKAEMGRGGF